MVLGLVTALGTIGINVAALVAGLGLTGFALGFALKDIISNSLAGILLIIYKPIQHGDHISVAAFRGNVVEINLRYTVLQGDNATIFVPNSTLFTNGITVETRSENES
jgi:small-conductance mechanosensitive channel